MDKATAKKRFTSQKRNAKTRGVEWNLTFEEWMEWWGDDLDRRGSGHDLLQMQRIGDAGAYELGNIRKGYPRDNSATYSRVTANKRAEEAKRRLQAALDAAMWEESAEPGEHPEDDENAIPGNLMLKGSGVMRYRFNS